MPVYPTGFTGESVVQCSHCNANDQGPEAGICHRNPYFNNTISSPACARCCNEADGVTPKGIFSSAAKGILDGMSGKVFQTPCSYCGGRGYRKL